MFLHCDVRKVGKGGWMSFQGEKYQVGGAYAGQEVRVKYEAEHPEELTIELGLAGCFPAFPGDMVRLELEAMDREALLVTGRILSVELE